MDQLETLVRDALTEHAEDAPGADRLLDGIARRPRRLFAALTAAAVIVAVAVGIVAFRPNSHHAAAPAAPPPGSKAVSYHGITFYVPRDLPTEGWVGCGFALPRYALIRHVDYLVSCPMMRPRRHPAVPRPVRLLVQLSSLDVRDRANKLADHSTDIDGVPARRGYGRLHDRDVDLSASGALVIPSLDLELVVTAPSRAQVDEVLRTVMVTPVDRNGCAGRVDSLSPPATNRHAAVIVPGAPTRVVLCAYQFSFSTNRPSYLTRSRSFGAQTTARLASKINSLASLYLPYPSDAGTTFEDVGTWLIFQYADGSQRVVTVEVISGRPAVTDGYRSALDRLGSITRILNR